MDASRQNPVVESEACSLDQSCPFCRQFGGGKVTPRVIRSNGRFTVFPTLGCFVLGYCLMVPTHHVAAFAHLDSATLDLLEAEMANITSLVSKKTGLPVVVGEHGEARSSSQEPSCNCVSHAHWHFVPANNPRNIFLEYCKTGGMPRVLNSLRELSKIEGPYLYLNVGTGQHLIWENTREFSRQFVRLVCACDHGMAPNFNWRQHPFFENIQVTKELLAPEFRFVSESVVAADADVGPMPGGEVARESRVTS